MDRVFLLDRSGSMESCCQDTIDGFNAFIETQKQFGGTMTLCLFDDRFETVYEKMPIEQVPVLTDDTFVPRGGTSLHDAMGQVLKMELSDDAMVIILTDGEENSSRTYTAAHIKDLVNLKSWKFVYLGANQDAVLTASELGIKTSLEYDVIRTPEVFRTLSETVSNYTQDPSLGLMF
jgi:uncharacterized protein with von Willebrand factor type A (vWA) domain